MSQPISKSVKSSKNTILRLDKISKSFPSIKVLNNVSLEVKKGEILAILGENGAGKSTLMKILSGLHQPDSGEIQINWDWFKDKSTSKGELQTTSLSNPREAMRLGIGMVYQHFQLVEPFTVAENIVLGKEFTKKSFPYIVDQDANNSYVRAISEQYGLPIDPEAIVEELPVGLRQRVEILKQLYRDAELLILDEPTAVLTPTDVVELFKTMKKLKESGKSQIFISHKLKEPLEIADRIIVIRKGEIIGEIKPSEANEEILAEMVVGRKILQQLDRTDVESDKPVLVVNNLSVSYPKSEKLAINDVSFQLNKNQIVGVAGVQGNGQSELVETLIGLRTAKTGSIYIFDEDDDKIDLTNKKVSERLKHGIGYVPEDRTTQGLILDFVLSENVWLGFFDIYNDTVDKENLEPETDIEQSNNLQSYYEQIKKRILVPIHGIEKLTRSIVEKFEVVTVSINARTRDLSGGNQQKLVLGREFAKNPRLIIASQPTRGVDIGVMEKVHEALINRRNEGAGILLISSDLDEILKLSDVIIVMYEGKVVGYDKIENMPVSIISQLMTTGRASKVKNGGNNK